MVLAIGWIKVSGSNRNRVGILGFGIGSGSLKEVPIPVSVLIFEIGTEIETVGPDLKY